MNDTKPKHTKVKYRGVFVSENATEYADVEAWSYWALWQVMRAAHERGELLQASGEVTRGAVLTGVEREVAGEGDQPSQWVPVVGVSI